MNKRHLYKQEKYAVNDEKKMLLIIELDSKKNETILCSFNMLFTKNTGQRGYEIALKNAVAELKKYGLFKKVVFFVGDNTWIRFDCITEKDESINDILVNPEMIAKYESLYDALRKVSSCITYIN
jgi:hypothetical protein